MISPANDPSGAVRRRLSAMIHVPVLLRRYGLPIRRLSRVRRGVLAERVEAADVDAERSHRCGGDDAVLVGETEMQRDLLAGGERLRPCGEIEMRRILPLQFAQQQQRIVRAADRARDVLLEDARVGLALRHGRVVGARLLLVGEIEQRGGGKDQQRHAQIGERLSKRAHPGSESRPPHRLCPADCGRDLGEMFYEPAHSGGSRRGNFQIG